jgi:hypothetical protein
MTARSIARTTLLVLGVCASAFLGARTVAQEMAAKNFERDASEFDRTRDQVAALFVAKADSLKQIARETTALKEGEEHKKELEKKIEGVIQELLRDTYSLALLTHLLALDNAVDKGGPAAEGPILGMLAAKFKVPIAELVSRREQSRLGIGGVMLGYAIARAAQLPPDEIFANKAGDRTWMEVMKDRQVSFAQLQTIFEDQKP